MFATGKMLGKGRAPTGGGQGRVVVGNGWRGDDAEAGGFDGVLRLVVVAAEKDVRDRRGTDRFGERADEGFLGLGGTDVGGLFGHGIEDLFAEGLLEKCDALVNALHLGGGLFVVLFVGKLFPLLVEFVDLVVVFAVVKVQ